MKLLSSMPKNLGMLLLAVWLIVTGLTMFVHVSFVNVTPLLGGLALVAGILLLLGR